jgi:hypothetical protein
LDTFRRGENLIGAGRAQRGFQQSPADASPAMGGIGHEQIDEVAPEEAGRPENDESSYRTAGQVHQAFT